MTLDKRTRAQMRAHCLEIHEDDGVDPREFFKPASRKQKQDHRKARQLCSQVAQTIDLILSGETADELLSCLRVGSVVPAPDTSRLLVTLVAELALNEFDRGEIERRLADHRGRLRTAVAAAITRRKAPTLALQLIGPDQARAATDEEGQR